MLNRFYRFRSAEVCGKIFSLALFGVLLAVLFALDVTFSTKLSKGAFIALLVLLAVFALNFVSAAIYLMFFDPGYVATVASGHSDQDLKYCEICNMVKPCRAHHCSVCNRCVYKYDHHCDVFKQCIAQYSLPYFFKFFVSAFLFLALSAVSGGLCWKMNLLSQMFTVGIAIAAVAVLIIGFSLFWDPIFHDLTQVDELQNQFVPRRGLLSNAKTNLGACWPVATLIPFAFFGPSLE